MTEHKTEPSQASPNEARRYTVRGRVQGVGFRWFVEAEAHKLRIGGWVRNTSDGAVELMAVGTRAQLAALQAKLWQGPRAARVDDVEERPAEVPESGPAGSTTFRIEGTW
jgi:acylphosphatase